MTALVQAASQYALAAAGIGAVSYGVDHYDELLNDLRLARTAAATTVVVQRMRAFGLTVPDIWESTVDNWGAKHAIVFHDVSLSFQNVDRLANRLANWLHAHGYNSARTVGLFCNNNPNFVIAWLALSKLGCKVAFLNTSLRAAALEHCLHAAECSALLFDPTLADAVQSLPGILKEFDEIHHIHPVLSLGPLPLTSPISAVDAVKASADSSSERPNRALRSGITLNDTFGFINTSGTIETGHFWPKLRAPKLRLMTVSVGWRPSRT